MCDTELLTMQLCCRSFISDKHFMWPLLSSLPILVLFNPPRFLYNRYSLLMLQSCTFPHPAPFQSFLWLPFIFWVSSSLRTAAMLQTLTFICYPRFLDTCNCVLSHMCFIFSACHFMLHTSPVSCNC